MHVLCFFSLTFVFEYSATYVGLEAKKTNRKRVTKSNRETVGHEGGRESERDEEGVRVRVGG